MDQKWPIELIKLNPLNQKWLTGQILNCLDLNPNRTENGQNWKVLSVENDQKSQLFSKNFSQINQIFWKGKNSEFSKNYKNVASNSNFYFHKIIVPAQILIEYLIMSSEWGALMKKSSPHYHHKKSE